MTVRQTIDAMLAYLRDEQRVIPYVHSETSVYDDPLPDAIASCNAALQQISSMGPLSAVKAQRSAYFRAPSTLEVSGLTNGGMTATGAFPAWSAGCLIELPGDSAMNRIISIAGTTATLQFPHLSATDSGTATINVDTVELDSDIVTVLEPVRYRGTKRTITAAGNREQLADGCGETRYFIESAQNNGEVKLRMMLSGYAQTDTVFEFQARTSIGRFTTADVYTDTEGYPDPGVPVPVPAAFVESIFLPLALNVFFSKPSVTNYDISSLRNQDAPRLIQAQAEQALAMLEQMRPQGKKPVGIRSLLHKW